VSDASPVLLPGATIGIFGGGQLGRLTAMAARSMGYRILVLDPDPACPARFVVDGCIEAAWNDSREAANLARGCDVVTLEIEQISLASMDAAASFAPVRPGRDMLAIIQDRIEQKDWLRRNGFPIGDYRAVRSLDQLREAVAALGGKCFCKSATGGYDGRGQGKVGFREPEATGATQPTVIPSERAAGVEGPPHLSLAEAEIRGAWEALGEAPGVVEQAIDLDREISILVARSPNGEVKVYPAAWNHHEHQILAWSVLPAPLPPALAAEASQLAQAIADTFQLEGILAVELFVTKSGRLLVNELAPRPHNSYHASERACVTSQFEQLVRAVCNLPLGDTAIVQPCAIANLLGDLWLTPAPDDVTPSEGAREAVILSDGAAPSEGGKEAVILSGGARDAVILSAGAAPSDGGKEAVTPSEGGKEAVILSAGGKEAVILSGGVADTVVEGPAVVSGPATSAPNHQPTTSNQQLTTNNQLPVTPRVPHFDRALAVPGVRLHLYEKLRPRKGRKMGHLSAVAPTPDEAVALVLYAKSLL
jgi:5-(carboxyamino)imidazole ribonucleotide synthase